MTPPVPRMDAAESRAWLALVGVSELLVADLDAELQRTGGVSNFEYGLLSLLKNAPGNQVRMKDLASALRSSKPRLTKAVTRLERRGHVERLRDDADARAVNVHLTPAGRRLVVAVTPAHIEHVRRTVIDGFTREQLEQVAAALEPLIERLDPRSGR